MRGEVCGVDRNTMLGTGNSLSQAISLIDSCIVLLAHFYIY
jgi:hypothetical protein